MSDLTFDLDEVLRNLDKRLQELIELQSNLSEPKPTIAEICIPEISGKILSLSRIKAVKKTAGVTIHGLTADKKAHAEQALANLGKVIQKHQDFTNILATVSTIVGSGETVIFLAATGLPGDPIRPPKDTGNPKKSDD